MVVRSKSYVYGYSIARIADSIPAEGMDVLSLVFVVLFVGSDLYDELVTPPPSCLCLGASCASRKKY